MSYGIIIFTTVHICPWHSWIARQTPTLKVEGSNPFGQAKKDNFQSKIVFFYPIRRIGMESSQVMASRLGVYIPCRFFYTRFCRDLNSKKAEFFSFFQLFSYVG